MIAYRRTTTLRPAMRTLLPGLCVAATLVLGACSSDDDDAMDPVIDGEVDTSGEEIMPGPGVVPDEDMDMDADGPLSYVIPLTVAEEIPAPTGADGASGTATLMYDSETGGLSGTIETTGLTGAPIGAHIHQGVLGETGDILIEFVADGMGTGGFELPGDTVLTAEQVTLLENGELYVNVHTDANPAGEIRGQIVEQDPEG